MPISFECTKAEATAAAAIARRYRALQKRVGVEPSPQQDIVMDLLAANANGCPLDFAKLQQADDFNLAHDVGGIARHLDRDDCSPTGGELLHCFLPRCARH